MQAVILAAGKGTRMLPLTLSTPKPMLLVNGKPILEHIIDALPETVSEVILVVGYRGDLIQSHFGTLYKGRLITYVNQEEQNGTFYALKTAHPAITGPFIMMNADDLHGSAGLEAAIQYPLALLVSRHEEPTKFGVVVKKEDGTLQSIIEKPEVAEDTLVSTGAMVLDDRIFDYEEEHTGAGEYYLTTALHKLADEHPVMVIEQSEWLPLGYPEDLANAEQILLAREEAKEAGVGFGPVEDEG